jgi:hypothetical protein
MFLFRRFAWRPRIVRAFSLLESSIFDFGSRLPAGAGNPTSRSRKKLHETAVPRASCDVARKVAHADIGAAMHSPLEIRGFPGISSGDRVPE